MTDWSKLKVAELKEECKTRDIPLTGLKLKQQYIDKLEEYEGDHTAPNPDSREEDSKRDDAPEGDEPNLNGEVTRQAGQPAVPEDGSHAEEDNEVDTGEPIAAAAPAQEAEVASKAEPEVVPTEDVRTAEQGSEDVLEEEKQVTANGVSVTHDEVTAAPKSSSPPTNEVPTEGQSSSRDASTPNATTSSIPLTPGSTQIPPAELAEDQRKRKRRSLTPAPSAEEVALKKAKANDGTSLVTDRGAGILKEVQEATDASQAMREADGQPNDRAEQTVQSLETAPTNLPSENTADRRTPEPGTTKEPPGFLPTDNKLTTAEARRERSPSNERPIAPAVHPATSSLYIRNFKRPLHVPTLKEHIIRLARSRTDPESDPIKTFYLDSIRTHAFISFISTAAASRVRSAMHETRYPDEPQREPLFVDFIPDEKVQEWIDRETGGGLGRGGNNRRFEVIYNDSANGIEASLEDADMSRQRPLPQRNSASVATKVPTGPSLGVHPDRAAFVPRAERQPSFPQRPPNRDAGETGFKALDELFSCTTTKPKLYYKPVSPEIVDDRLDMVRGLRVGHADMGRSGEEGMKRYSFEKYKDREEWVDKGPEFGHGQRGQAIMRGQRGRGGGGYRGGRGGDSWRGR